MHPSADPAVILRRWFQEVWNESREPTIYELCHPKAIVHGLTDNTGITLGGPAGFRVFYDRFRSSFSNMHVRVEDAFCQGNKGVARITFTGSHTGPGLGVPPTNRSVRVTGMVIIHTDGRQITEGWNEFDTASLLDQIQHPLDTQVMA